MKKLIFVFISLALLLVKPLQATQPVSEDKQLYDSIFNVYHSLTGIDAKVHFMRTMLLANADKSWVIELLDSTLALSISEQNSNLELAVRNDYYWHYKFQADLPQMEHYFNELRQASLKYKHYNYYFQIWNDILQFYNARGDTEYVRMQSLKMEDEAKKLGYQEGITYAYMSMARALVASKKEDEGIKMFRKVLGSTAVKDMTRVLAHSEIATIYQQRGENEKAIKELQIQQAELNKHLIEDSQGTASYRDYRLELELSFCAVYNNLNDTKNLLKHLKEAKKYYAPDCFFSYYIGYHAYWGAYYRLIHQWDDCFTEFDIALARFQNTQPLYEMVIRRMKGEAFIEAGKFDDAARLYKGLSFMGDSLNNDVIKLHQEALHANYKIRKALLEKGTAEKRYNQVIVGFILILVLALFGMVLHALRGRKALRKAEKETREALETVDAANKMKEVFLHNITYQIRGPLNVVVGFSEILATEKDLTSDQIQEYSVSIKKNAGILFQLIIDILDLSRLESGMMKFNVSDCDAVQMCKDAKMMVEMQENNVVSLDFNTNLDALMIQTDSGRFLKMLISLLSAPQDYQGEVNVKYTLLCENGYLEIKVTGSPLLQQSDNTQRIQHDINRIFLETFKGTYGLPGSQDIVIVSYPLNPK